MTERGPFKVAVRAVRHRIYLFVALVAAFTLAAGLAAIFRPPTYQGTALLFVDQRFDPTKAIGVSLQGGKSLSDHYVQAATSHSVLTRACSGAYFDTPVTSGFRCDAGSLASQVSASTVGGQDWIAVNVTASSATEAAALANAVGQAMTDQNKAEIDQLLAPSRGYLSAELTSLDASIQAGQATLDQLQTQQSPDQQVLIANAQANVKLLQSQYLAADARLQDLVVEGNWLAGSLVVDQAATPPLKPIDPDPVRYLAVGLLAGLCVGLVAALVVDRIDDRLFDIETFSRAAGTRDVVAVTLRDSASLSNRGVNPYTVAREALLALRADLNTVIIAAASSRENLGPVAAGLGTAAVKVGQKVLVVEADSPTHVMQQSGRKGSRLIVVGDPDGADPLAANGSAAKTEPKYDLTIRVTRAPLDLASATSLAQTGDIATVVAAAGLTHYSDVERTAATLRLAGIRVAVGILTTDSINQARVIEERREPEAEPEPYGVAAKVTLPIWRGPGV